MATETKRREIERTMNYIAQPQPRTPQIGAAYNPSIITEINEAEFAQLKKWIQITKKKKVNNIIKRNNVSEGDKILRLKSEAVTHLDELHDQLTKNGLDIKYSVLTEFLLLKALGKLPSL